MAHASDPGRLAAVRSAGLLGALPEPALDRLTALASRLLGVPIASIGVIEEERHLIKSLVGPVESWPARREVPLSHSFCRHVVETEQPVLIEDARLDERVRDTPGVGESGVVAYLGVPLVTRAGHVLGALCAVDRKARRWSEDEVATLRDLAALVMTEVDLRRALAEARSQADELARSTASLHDRKERLRRLSDAAFEGIIVSHQGRILDANEAAVRMFGYRHDEIADLSVGAFVHPAERENVAQKQRSNFEGVYETIGRRKDGSMFPLEARGRLAPWGDRTVRITAIRDLTERAHAARELERQQGFMRLLEAAAVAANEARTAGDAMQTCLALVASHTGWSLGHVYVSDEKRPGMLVPTDLWHDGGDDPERVRPFVEATGWTTVESGAGLAGRVVAAGQAVWMPDVLADASCPRVGAARESGLRSGFAFPVMVGRVIAAVLEFYSARDDALDPALLDVLKQVGTQLGRVIERERARLALERHAAEIQMLSLRDELTGLFNRRGFLTLAAQQLKHLDRTGSSALLFFADLNGMKQINDALGHDAGDGALRALAHVLRGTFRDADVLARLGGDEFVVLAHSADPDTAEALTARLQANVARHNAATGERPFRLSVSCGSAFYDGRHPRGLDEVLAEADARMYEQKRIRQSARVSGQVPLVPGDEEGGGRSPGAP